MAKLIDCIHGMLWQTCGKCHEGTEQDVLDALQQQKEEIESKLLSKQVFQEKVEEDEPEIDFDYDIEIDD